MGGIIISGESGIRTNGTFASTPAFSEGALRAKLANSTKIIKQLCSERG